MQLRKIYQNWFLKSYAPEITDDLEELMVYLWWKIHKDGNTLRLIQDKKFQKEQYKHLTDSVWVQLNDDFVDYFGVTQSKANYFSLIRRIQEHKVNFAVTKNRWHVGQIMALEAELKALTNNNGKHNEYDSLTDVQMTTGLKLNPRELSVIEYYSAQNKAVKISKEQRAASNARKYKKGK